MINAVRVDHPRGSTWVTDATSISTYGRFEAIISTSDDLSDADIQRRGQAVMAGKLSPAVSIQADPVIGDVPGVDFVTGDYVTVDGEEQRVVDIQWRMDRTTGEWEPPTPTFSTAWERRLLDADRAFDRLVRAQGGGAVDAAANPERSLVPVEPVQSIETLSWSSYDSAASGSRDVLDDDTPWAGKSVQRLSRMAGIYFDADFTSATGNTVVQLWKNGSEWSSLFRITIPSTTPSPWIYTPTYGYSFIEPGDVLAPRVTSNGQHRQISYHLMVWPAL